MNSLNRLDPRSSAGLGGFFPAVRSQRLGVRVRFTVSPALASPTITFESPGSSGTPHSSCVFGRRISASIKRTLWPATASDMATLAETTLLPSPGPVLVTRIDFDQASAEENTTFV